MTTTQGATEYTDKVGDGAGVFKSNDRGNSWLKLTMGSIASKPIY